MSDARQPHQVFFETWRAEVGHLPREGPVDRGSEHLAKISHALMVARHRSWLYGCKALGWSDVEASLVSGHLAVTLLHWLRTDGTDLELLRARLQAAQERAWTDLAVGADDPLGRLEEVLGGHFQLLFGLRSEDRQEG